MFKKVAVLVCDIVPVELTVIVLAELSLDAGADYAGKLYPATETAYTFSQAGSGTNGGFYHDQVYQWTPAIVNHQYFGVRIDNYPPVGKGSVQICYDLIEVTVEYV